MCRLYEYFYQLLKTRAFCFYKSELFLLIYKDGNPNYKSANIERKYLNIMQKNQFLKVKNSLLELEKDFIDLKYIELKDRDRRTIF